ncbi:MAG: glycine cleavage system protein GcvH [Chloroflexi bacterium]|nr:glycine cleavage system protein GcvH [Chloroflexota bacterium]
MDPETLRYTREHEWVGIVADDEALVGITNFAQFELGDVVYLELPAPGTRLRQAGKFGEVESVKSISDLFAPVSGEVLEANTALKDHPELVNKDPYGQGWMLRVRLDDRRELEGLLSLSEYERMLRETGAVG